METITLGLNAAQQAPNMSFMLIIYIVIFVGLMWFMSRKSRKQEREEAAMRNNLMIGDEIIHFIGVHSLHVHALAAFGRDVFQHDFARKHIGELFLIRFIAAFRIEVAEDERP